MRQPGGLGHRDIDHHQQFQRADADHQGETGDADQSAEADARIGRIDDEARQHLEAVLGANPTNINAKELFDTMAA